MSVTSTNDLTEEEIKSGILFDDEDGKVPSNTVYALLPAVRTSILLDDFHKVGFDPFDELILTKQPALGYQMRLVKSLIFNNF